MRTLNIAAIFSTAVLLAAGAAHAEDAFKKNDYNHNFMSKRPYQAAVANTVQQKDQQWEGATLIASPVVEEDLNNQSKSRLNMFSKRPY
ncbi:MAG: hypothetical protein Q8M99_07085 [Methylotenera sp.]|nr:hypothetical protein [Methylotenera sp.]